MLSWYYVLTGAQGLPVLEQIFEAQLVQLHTWNWVAAAARWVLAVCHGLPSRGVNAIFHMVLTIFVLLWAASVLAGTLTLWVLPRQRTETPGALLLIVLRLGVASSLDCGAQQGSAQQSVPIQLQDANSVCMLSGGHSATQSCHRFIHCTGC